MRRRHFLAAGVAAAIARRRNEAFAGNAVPNVPEAEPNDRALLQAALDAGGHVRLDKGRRYRIAPPSGQKAALLIGSNTFLDLSGAVLELVGREASTLFSTRTGTRNHTIRIAGGEIVANGAQRPVKYSDESGLTPTLHLVDCDAVELVDLRLRDTYMYAAYLRGNRGRLHNVSVQNAIGGGIHVTGAEWKIDRIDVRDVTYFDPVNCTGNPFIATLTRSTVGAIRCENYGFGVKFQDGCDDVRIDSIVAISGSNNDKNRDYLVKIQGLNDSRGKRFNHAIRIGTIVARNGPASGLYIVYCDGLEIGSYLGENNGRVWHMDAKNGADVLIIDSRRVHFGTLRARDVHRCGLWIHDNARDVSADRVEMQAGGGGHALPVVDFSKSAVFGTSVLEGFSR